MSNRSQRRKLAKHNLSPKQMTQALKQEQYNGIMQAVEAMFVVTAYELHRRGWKKESIQQFLKRIDYSFDSIGKDYIGLAGMREILKEEIDLTI